MVKRVVVLAFTTLSQAFGSACTAEEYVAYPADWPERVRVTRCAELSGHYTNEATNIALYASAVADPNAAREFLAGLLADGGIGMRSIDGLRPIAEDLQLISSVELNAEAVSATTYRTNSKLPTAILLSKEWSCMPSGELMSTFQFSIDSEGSIGSRTRVVVTLSKAADGSLIAHRVITFHALFPRGGLQESWARFQSLGNHSRQSGSQGS